MKIKEEWINFSDDLQSHICTALEQCDGKAKFIEDEWKREQGGGGKTRIISNGNVFEKGGVNTSVVFGNVTKVMETQLKIPPLEDGKAWFACGLSLVLHPQNPFVPTVHCNYRMFELYNKNDVLIDRWFGGGTDLTPYYLFEEDAKHFHTTYKNVCDEFDKDFYSAFKKNCDNYFVNKHRNNERRGIGGIFFDYQREDEKHDASFWMNFCKACGNAFVNAYIPIVEKRKNISFNEHNKFWQEIRRGRYVEFNLIHDRGTLFGLKTNGRTESILMSLPPTVRFEYNYEPLKGSAEADLVEVCLHSKNWI
ncbi:MAG: oxygen-dependent coproporphyrinogen oxidase [Chitinophagaceae bacterium]